MAIEEVLNRSYKLLYDDHICKLISIPAKYLAEIRPNKKTQYSDLFKSFNSVVARSLDEYGDNLLSETKKFLAAKRSLSIQEKEKIQKAIESHLQPELYIKRFDIFVVSISLRLSRYDLMFDTEINRVDIPKSLAVVNAKNTCRKIKTKIVNEIDVLMLNFEAVESQTRAYRYINNLYSNHQFVFWGLGLVISVILGMILV